MLLLQREVRSTLCPVGVSVYLSVCLSVCLICLSVCLICLSVRSTYLSVDQSTHPFVGLSVCLSVYPPTHLNTYACIHMRMNA